MIRVDINSTDQDIIAYAKQREPIQGRYWVVLHEGCQGGLADVARVDFRGTEVIVERVKL